ncbi:MAG: GNAT family N-acetyltransferase [Thermoplasmata archaeon]|nr:MAG: GNAT family N-acetyltransferase [Thermoplasmata archaeon]
MGAAQPEHILEPASSRDVRAVLRLIEEAGWAYTRDELERLIAVQPGGLILLRSTGLRHGVLGCVYASAWGNVGFIGLMLVKGVHRGKGLGMELMMAAMDHLRDRGCTSICLDAVLEATGFYRRMDFRSTWQSLRLGIDTSKGSTRPPEVEVRKAGDADMDQVIDLDRNQSGMDRTDLLRRLQADSDSTIRVVSTQDELLAYGVIRRSKGCMRLGPVVAAPRVEDSTAVRALVVSAKVESYPRMLTVNVPAYNKEAVEMVLGMGAVEYAPCTRMCLGDPGPADTPEGVWALGAAEKG